MKLKLIALALAALAGTAHAQTSTASAAKRELVQKVVKLQQPGIEASAQSLAEQPAVQLAQQAQIELMKLPQDKRESVGRDLQGDLKKYVEETAPLVRDRLTRLAPAAIAPLLEERFSEDELKQIVAFLESPVVRKFQQLGPEMQRAVMQKVGPELQPVVEPKLRALQAAMAQHLGLPPPKPATATPAPAPAKK